jgi:hypothetical protein
VCSCCSRILSVAALAFLPFLNAHVLVLATPATVATYPGQLAHAADGIGHCAYPAYTATLLLAIVTIYMLLLATTRWDVTVVSVNRRLRGEGICALRAHMRAGYSCGCGRTPAPGRCRR